MILDSVLDSPDSGKPGEEIENRTQPVTGRPPVLPRRIPVRAPVLRVLPGTPDSAKAARLLTCELLGDDDPATETAMLLVSELVTNSITHSQSGRPGGTVTVALCAGPAGVLIQVRDDGGPAEPRLAAADGQCPGGSEHGYGLVLVAALADTWGSLATAEGRVTWCRVTGCAGASGCYETKV
jgi:anti-sigma regulatory factor (Ser/Thr protein kinase)